MAFFETRYYSFCKYFVDKLKTKQKRLTQAFYYFKFFEKCMYRGYKPRLIDWLI